LFRFGRHARFGEQPVEPMPLPPLPKVQEGEPGWIFSQGEPDT
jgi:hypothetical protein